MLRLKHFREERSVRREENNKATGNRQQPREMLSIDTGLFHSNIRGIHPFQLNKLFLLHFPIILSSKLFQYWPGFNLKL
jgi:hypothetical protein